ncbi:unnamed protein product [Lathyrus oleraceus]
METHPSSFTHSLSNSKKRRKRITLTLQSSATPKLFTGGDGAQPSLTPQILLNGTEDTLPHSIKRRRQRTTPIQTESHVGRSVLGFDRDSRSRLSNDNQTQLNRPTRREGKPTGDGEIGSVGECRIPSSCASLSFNPLPPSSSLRLTTMCFLYAIVLVWLSVSFCSGLSVENRAYLDCVFEGLMDDIFDWIEGWLIGSQRILKMNCRVLREGTQYICTWLMWLMQLVLCVCILMACSLDRISLLCIYRRCRFGFGFAVVSCFDYHMHLYFVLNCICAFYFHDQAAFWLCSSLPLVYGVNALASASFGLAALCSSSRLDFDLQLCFKLCACILLVAYQRLAWIQL